MCLFAFVVALVVAVPLWCRRLSLAAIGTAWCVTPCPLLAPRAAVPGALCHWHGVVCHTMSPLVTRAAVPGALPGPLAAALSPHFASSGPRGSSY